MEYRHFGRTDLQVSAVGFGCWEIGGTYGRIDERGFQLAVARAIDSGVTCFDTAEAYGMGVSEEAAASALGARRRQVVIATKFGVGYEEMPNRRDSSRGRILASIDKSLRMPPGWLED
jgi:aryl-alcohol dehydrogenase-like predicted oxidoreductase